MFADALRCERRQKPVSVRNSSQSARKPTIASSSKRAKSERDRCSRSQTTMLHARHACVHLRAYSSRAPSDRRRQAHPCLGPSTPSPLAASEPAHASSASPSPPRARTARTLALLADCAHACDPHADANDASPISSAYLDAVTRLRRRRWRGGALLG